jgi:hypothetical protein
MSCVRLVTCIEMRSLEFAEIDFENVGWKSIATQERFVRHVLFDLS